jgi:sugar-specific transcriptional regulator TrmB
LKKGAIESTLRDFGLTEKEVEVYIFLGKRGALKGGDITRQLRMHKGQVYRTLKSLQKKGLVEATLEYPARFTAVPFEKLIDSFIKSKQEEVALIEEKKEDLLSDWNRISQTELDSSLEKFSVIEGNKKIFHKISQMVKESKSQVLMALTVSDLFRAEQFGVFDYVQGHPIRLQIDFRVLTQLSKQNLKAAKILKPKMKPINVFRGINPDLGLPPFSRMVIRDKEEIILFISDKVNQYSKEGKEVCLCTNCKSIIQAFSGVFEELWQDSTDIEHLIDLFETGKSPPKTQIIKDPSSAKESYYEILNSANEEVLIVTSSEGLIGLSKNKSQLEEWSKIGVSIRIMAPIVNENLDVTLQLLKWCEIRHVPLGYFETTIIDGHHLFQFKPASSPQRALHEMSDFENTLYTTDLDYIQKTKNLLLEIWRKTRTPSSDRVEPIIRPIKTRPKSLMGHHSLVKKTSFKRNMEYKQTGKISDKDVLDKIEKEKKLSSIHSGNWLDIARFFGSSAAAVIHPPKSFNLPDMTIFATHNDEDSSFGAENWLLFFLWQKIKEGFYYVPVALVIDNPKTLAFRKAVFAGFPVENNFLVVKRDEIQVRVKGKTLFAGWTRPIPLGFSNYVVPPSCLLFEGYGDVKPGMLTNVALSGRGQERWFNSFDAFVSYFHPQSKYVGSGTEGFIEIDSILISTPPQPDM